MLLEELFLEIAGANLLRSRPERSKVSDKPEYQTLSAASSHVKNIQDIQKRLDDISRIEKSKFHPRGGGTAIKKQARARKPQLLKDLEAHKDELEKITGVRNIRDLRVVQGTGTDDDNWLWGFGKSSCVIKQKTGKYRTLSPCPKLLQTRANYSDSTSIEKALQRKKAKDGKKRAEKEKSQRGFDGNLLPKSSDNDSTSKE